ncbi:hypothetical protein Aros01_06535 [Streptosporangium roseum]|uniref:Uncharacterized protein n=1 Tax=Streptosporangium roseum (strain ATCC 12428 / DSM 43021 / JCM 3005 / KCTC 9067 / NCIMB 10171 / NRRL 2505 / NI 9100) TaxID=479432 RepID=D2BBJ7_STRRD|nr:hypothetical protein Sros_3119 [Streptosporangium roseum DSM 43021]
MTRRPVTARAVRSLQAAERLRAALHQLGIATDVHAGYDLALVSVWVELIVWSDGRLYWWWSGRKARRSGRWIYVIHSTDAPDTAARRVAARYTHLWRTHPLSRTVEEVAS